MILSLFNFITYTSFKFNSMSIKKLLINKINKSKDTNINTINGIK